MKTHWQVGMIPHGSLCGVENQPVRCLTNCDYCARERDKVDCPQCIELAKEMYSNIIHFHRHGGPHAETL